MLSFLQKPHPFIFNAGSVLIPGIFTFLLIGLFKPLGFNSLPTIYLLSFALGLALVASLTVLLTVLSLKQLLPSWMDEENWTIGKEVALIFIVVNIIAVILFIIFMSIDIGGNKPMELFRIVFINTIIISLFPILFMVIFEQYMHQRKQLGIADTLNRELRAEDRPNDQIYAVKAENGQMALQLHAFEILYAESDGNYIELYYLDANKEIKKELIRNRLKNLVEQLPLNSFFHCHKSFLINLVHVKKIQGNARNLEIVLRFGDQLIPVSRSKSAELKERINTLA